MLASHQLVVAFELFYIILINVLIPIDIQVVESGIPLLETGFKFAFPSFSRLLFIKKKKKTRLLLKMYFTLIYQLFLSNFKYSMETE